MARTRESITSADVEMDLDYKPETGEFIRRRKGNQHPAGSVAGTLFDSGARQIKLLGVDFMDYDLAWLVSYGKKPEGRVVHLDGNKANCKIDNLFDLRDGIELNQDILSLLLKYDPTTGVFTRRIAMGSRSSVGSEVGTTSKHLGYVLIGVLGGLYFAHRLAWLYVHGAWPNDQIDHINGIRTDNRIVNLRDVTASINNQNKREALSNNKSSGLLGVAWSVPMQAYVAYIGLDGQRSTLGYFADKHAAHQCYLNAKRAMHAGCTI